MSKTTTLAESQITPSTDDVIEVQLVQPDDMPAVIRIAWPPQPRVCDPRRFPDTAATIARLFAEAATTLAHIRATKRL